MIVMRWLVFLALASCNGSSSSDAGSAADSGATGDSAMEQDAGTDTGLIQDSGGPTTCVVPKGGTTCNGQTWQCDETDDCASGACCLKIDGMKNVTGSV